MKRILCLWFPHWPLQRAVVARPELRGKPVALVVSAARGECIVVCSRAAAAQGVRPGQSLSEALAACSFDWPGKKKAPPHRDRFLAAQIPWRKGLLPYDPVGDREALGNLAGECERFAPGVGFEIVAGEPEGLLLEVTGIGPLFGGEVKLAQAVAENFFCRGYEPRVALADTLGAAWALAHYGGQPLSIIPVGQTAAALDPLSPAALRLPGEMLALLAQLGIESIGQLRRLPRAGLAARFGELLLQRLDQAWGEVPEGYLSYRAPPEYVAEHAPEFPLERRERVKIHLRELSQAISEQLAAQGKGALRLECRLDGAASMPVAIQIGFYAPTAIAERFEELLGLALEQVSLPEKVTRLRLEVTLAALLEQRQTDLFATSRQQASRQLGPLIDRLSSRLGRCRVVRVRLQNDAQPERVCRYQPWAGEARQAWVSANSVARNRRTEKASSCSPHAGRADVRPLRLLAEPRPLKVQTLAPHGPPLCFTLADRQERVVRHWGPERLETGWWRGHGVRRDYYRVETENGRRYWLFRELGGGSWFWHGTFE